MSVEQLKHYEPINVNYYLYLLSVIPRHSVSYFMKLKKWIYHVSFVCEKWVIKHKLIWRL